MVTTIYRVRADAIRVAFDVCPNATVNKTTSPRTVTCGCIKDDAGNPSPAHQVMMFPLNPQAGDTRSVAEWCFAHAVEAVRIVNAQRFADWVDTLPDAPAPLRQSVLGI